MTETKKEEVIEEIKYVATCHLCGLSYIMPERMSYQMRTSKWLCLRCITKMHSDKNTPRKYNPPGPKPKEK